MMLPRLALLGSFALLSPVNAIWPAPKEFSSGDKVLFIAQTLEITYNGGSVRWSFPESDNPPPPGTGFVDTETLFNVQLPYTYGYDPAPGPRCHDKDMVQGGISRALGAIFQHNFVPWMLRPRNSDFEPDVYQDKKWVKSLTINHEDKGDSSCYKPLAGEVDESYTLELTEDGAATIEAKTSVGVLRA